MIYLDLIVQLLFEKSQAIKKKLYYPEYIRPIVRSSSAINTNNPKELKNNIYVYKGFVSI